METKLHRSLAFPFFLLSMILLSGVFTLGAQFKENNLSYAFVAIIASVIIYFFNDFSAVLGKTEKLPIEIAVWMPITVVFIFSAVGIINVNQK
jgi:lipopolysaccharide export LptBFGC system permease protein LptF